MRGGLTSAVFPGHSAPSQGSAFTPAGSLTLSSRLGFSGKGAAVLLVSFLLGARAEAVFDVDGFDPGANNIVRQFIVQPDNNILVGGDFTVLGPAADTRNFIGRVGPSGALDPAFDPGANSSVLTMARQNNGQILVGGFFSTLGGGGSGDTVRNFIGRLNSDGSLDAAFNPGADGTVYAIALQTDGKILVGGSFTMLGGGGTGTIARNHIGRLNADGTVDPAFDPGADGDVYTIVQEGDLRILVGGNFTNLGGVVGVTRNALGRLNLDGSLDLAFDPGANNSVFVLAVQADDKILVGGIFTTLGGGGTGQSPRNQIGRLNLDGSLDASFDPGADNAVRALAVQADGGVLVGGDFTTLGGGGSGTSARNFIGRLDSGGAIDPAFNPGANAGVYALTIQPDGKILVGGIFTGLGGGGSTVRNFLGRLADLSPPVITSPLTATATVGQPFTYQFLATEATQLDVIGLPPDFTFDPVIAAITGTPTADGSFNVELIASNSVGSDNQTLVLTVQPAPADGPVIISSTSVTGRTGQPFSFQVLTRGGTAAERLSAANLPAGLVIDPVLGLITGTATQDGSTSVELTVTDGSFTTTGTLEITFVSDLAVPVITSASKASIDPGTAFSYQTVAPSSDSLDTISYSVVGPLPAGLGLNSQSGIISGTPIAANRAGPGPQLSGGVVSNVQLFATNSSGTGTIPLVFFLPPVGTVNISTRLAVGLADNVLIGGFIITGNAPKKVLIRGIGPSLPVAGALQDTTLDLYDNSGLLGSNDNWRDSQEQEIIATTIPPTYDLESAIVAILEPGAYTAIVSGKNNSTGIGLVEVYDLGTASFDISSLAQLVNISTRGLVQTGDNVMIGGFIVSGNDPVNLLVRAIGPELTGKGVPGALQDTTLDLRNGNGDLLAFNDDWESDQKQEIIDTTVPPTDPRESAIVSTLSSGAYTAILQGKNGTTGVALVEVYVLP